MWRYTTTNRLLLVLGAVAAVAIRLLLLPSEGLRGDIDQFVRWVHELTTGPIERAYDTNMSFPPVMVYVFAALGWLVPGFQTVTDAADPAIRAVMKLPASLADLAMAALILAGSPLAPVWALLAALALALHPAIIDVSAWWGQFESIYLLGALIAYLASISSHPLIAAIALGVSLTTKPQALVFIVPLAAWFLARYGVRRAVGYGLAAGATIALLWLPFLAAGGPAGYARNLAEYQGDIFAVLSVNAWNLWWLVNEGLGGEVFYSDLQPLLGPLSARSIGLLLTALGEILVFILVLRRPTARGLALGLASSVLIAFSLLTTMHERYAYGALIFLVFLLPERRGRWLWLTFGAVLTLNLLAAAPPIGELEALLEHDVFQIGGPIVMLGCTAASLFALRAEPPVGSPPELGSAPQKHGPGGRLARAAPRGQARLTPPAFRP